MAQAKKQFDPTVQLKKLVAITEQIGAAKDVDAAARNQATAWKKMGDKVDELLTAVAAANGKPADDRTEQDNRNLRAVHGLTGLSTVAETLRKVATNLNPIAEISWDQQELDDLLTVVRTGMIMGFFDGEDIDTADTAIKAATEALSKRAGGSRGPGRTIEGRPEFVKVLTVVDDDTDDTPETITRQAGNKESSVGNVVGAVVRYLESKGVTVTDDTKKAINEAVGDLIRNNKDEAPVLDFAVIVNDTGNDE